MYVIVMDILILVTISHIIKSFELFELKTIIAYNKSNSATCIILSQIQNQCMASWGLSDLKKILSGHPPPPMGVSEPVSSRLRIGYDMCYFRGICP